MRGGLIEQHTCQVRSRRISNERHDYPELTRNFDNHRGERNNFHRSRNRKTELFFRFFPLHYKFQSNRFRLQNGSFGSFRFREKIVLVAAGSGKNCRRKPILSSCFELPHLRRSRLVHLF
ncbi:hypothetical protein H6P81_007076 [Aristolochia fimbriata]|uniref:Uncharacterized protein n=1 Tax=Aristolochia fimbriata TaxID=158543 RepID=A0AAV7F2Z6_ARIFI|nr:hypothetical protein H6P81_007076 [Aristolochia fimbriata]